MGRAVTIQATRWKLAGASIIGKQHEDAGGRCEDAWSSARRALPTGHEVLAVCVSDGAGSAENGGAGAQITSRVLANWLVENAEKLFDSVTDDSRSSIVSTLKRVLRRAAWKSSAVIKSYACTVVAVLTVDDGRWLTVHLGDGAIVGRFGGILKAVSIPRKGEFANETFFVTDNDASESLDIQMSSSYEDGNSATAFAMFTDGVESSLVNRRTNEVSRVLGDMFGWLTNNSEREVTLALEDNLRLVFRQRTGDDCSLAIIVQGPQDEDAPEPMTSNAAANAT
jgi:Protein phosphatase 2C